MDKKTQVLIAFVAALVVCSTAVVCGAVPLQESAGRQAETLIFDDSFDSFDLKTWKHEITLGGGGNWEFQLYHNNRTNSYVRDGVLYIRPTLTREKIGRENMMSMRMDMWGSYPANLCTGNAFYGCERIGGGGGNVLNPIQSARIRTAESFSFRYGRVEVRAKMPIGDWLWPAIWLLPTSNAYGDWPASGEIDIIEARGNSNGYPGGIDQVSSALHWGPHYPENGYPMTYGEYRLPAGQNFNQEFHVFGLVWTETEIKTYVDREENVIMRIPITQSFWEKGGWSRSSFNNPWVTGGTNAPFDQDFYLIFNLACGGTGGFFPDGVGPKPWSNNDPNAVNAFYNSEPQWYPTWKGEDSALQIDYVRVWKF
eukprot:TRINITY_DN15897_c0_g1_i1.p1 TRINITY_DN15897_c0_g1~~TRINITY_DN15897_c0_g1_i1.p1  ORF type:complete len:368 (-),score=59.01 TRINITY_DN15897_c0_g1_i1:132-1235(-)